MFAPLPKWAAGEGEVLEVTSRGGVAVGLACIGMLVMHGEAGPICEVVDIFQVSVEGGPEPR